MVQTLIDISWWQLACFSLLLSIPFFINYKLQVSINHKAIVSIIRMAIQLALVGLYLKYIFILNNQLLNILWLLVMLLVGVSAILSNSNVNKRFLLIPVFSGLFVSLIPLMFVILFFILTPTPLLSAQYLIPIGGMLLGNSLSGNIFALQHLENSFNKRSGEYEAYLSLGATVEQASVDFRRDALQSALAPTIATMATAGVVTLPGMMTGQILAGADPMIAIKYQIMIMISIFVMMNISVATCLKLTTKFAIKHNGLVKIKKPVR